MSPLLLGLILVLSLLLLAIGVERWLNRTPPGEWTSGAPLALPGPDEVSKVEIRRWQRTDWREMPVESARTLLISLARNNEHVPPPGLRCAIPVPAEYELRLQMRTGAPRRLALSARCSAIVSSGIENPGGRDSPERPTLSDDRTWVLNPEAQGAALAEIEKALPGTPRPEDR